MKPRDFHRILLEFALVRRFLFIFLVAAVGVSFADTIRLKNGRSIRADKVTEVGDKVEYEIGDNLYRIPKSLVERIDSSLPALPDPDSGPTQPAARPNSEAVAKPTPNLPADQELHLPGMKAGLKVVRDGRVDLDALNALEASGQTDAAAGGYFLAAKFEFERGDRESARRYMERALGYAPDNPSILTNYAALLIQLGRAREAINFAHHATVAAPDSPDAWDVLGYAYFNSDRTRDAVPSWERSLELRPDPRVKAFLAKARREQQAEANFSEHDTGRFTLRYEGSATKDTLRSQIIAALEKDYDELASQLGIQPTQNIPVILYTEQTFFDVTQAPSWTGALNDGKLRIPIQGVDFINPELARVLKHELAHSFINQASAGRCPQWLNEGIAQLAEGRQLASRTRLAALYKNNAQIPFSRLEQSFMGFSTNQAVIAYDESLAAAAFINGQYGMSDLRRLLERLAQGGSVEDAMRDVLRADYPRFEQDLGDYLGR